MGKDAFECDYVGMVDFGDGLVPVRCTLTGPHEEHKCEVVLASATPREGFVTRNVFEADEEARHGD